MHHQLTAAHGGRIEAACGTALPNQIDGKIRKAKGLVAKAALTQSPVKARKSLRIALKNLKKALRAALARRDRDKLDLGCASVLESEINDIMTPAMDSVMSFKSDPSSLTQANDQVNQLFQ